MRKPNEPSRKFELWSLPRNPTKIRAYRLDLTGILDKSKVWVAEQLEISENRIVLPQVIRKQRQCVPMKNTKEWFVQSHVLVVRFGE